MTSESNSPTRVQFATVRDAGGIQDFPQVSADGAFARLFQDHARFSQNDLLRYSGKQNQKSGDFLNQAVFRIKSSWCFVAILGTAKQRAMQWF